MASMDVQASNWLQRTHGVKVPGDWLIACVEWLQEEHQGSLTNMQLFSQVYDQWLFADLRELALPSLPNDLCNMEKIQLDHVYCLQVDSIIDIGTSYYSQLLKVTGKENPNAEVSAAQPQQPFWEPKPKRMLMLNLTDGVTDVKGMEYRIIPALNTSLAAGVKVKIKGKVLCRRGVLMLQSENFEVMGGEVEGLMEANTQHNCLQNKLEANVNNPTKPETKEFHQDVKNNQVKNNQNNQRQPVNIARQPNNNSQRRQQAPQAKNNVAKPPIKEQSQALDELGNEWDDDDFDLDDIIQHLDSPPLENRNSAQTANQPTQQNPPGGNVGIRTAAPSGVNVNNSANNGFAKTEQQSMTGKRLSKSQSKLTNNKPANVTNLGGAGNALRMPNAQCVASNGIRPNTAVNNSNSTKPYSSSMMNNCNQRTNQEGKASPNQLRRPSSMSSTSNHSFDTKDVKPNVSSIRREMVRDVWSEQESLKRKWDEFEDKKLVKAFKSESKVKVERPWLYLSQVLPNPPPVCHVKAYISTVVGKIDHHNGTFWSLPVKINDGSATIDVDLSDQFMTSLIGFSAQEYIAMKARISKEPHLRAAIMNSLNNCQRQIVELNSILELHFSPQHPRPLVMRAIQLSDVHLHALTAVVGSDA